MASIRSVAPVLCCFILLVTQSGISSEAKEKPQKSSRLGTASQKLLMAHYMPWYAARRSPCSWGWHWTMGKYDSEKRRSDGLPEIASHVHPLIGLYDSNDTGVIECQALQMKLAGISGVIVDWYGTTAFADYRMIHAATKKVFEVTKRVGILFAVCYEDRTVGVMVSKGALSEQEVVRSKNSEARILH